MAAMVVQKTVNRWTGNETSRAGYLRALEPGDANALKDLETMVLGMPHFEVYGTTDTNTADSDAINLSTAGVTFPNATQRIVKVEASVADNDGQGLLVYTFQVDGGTTPIVTAVQVDAALNLDDSGLAGAPTLDFEVVANQVILEAVGISAVPCRWVLRIWVSDAIPLAYNP